MQNRVTSLPALTRGGRIGRRYDAVLPRPVVTKEQTLLAACRNGDPLAQEQIYESHREKIYRLMIRMVGLEQAEDLTQQVFLKVFQKIEQFQGNAALSTWIFRIAANESLQYLRRKSRRPEFPLNVEPLDHRPVVGKQLEDREVLAHALANLEPDLRVVFLLREVDGLSYFELAKVLDIAEGTVASRLNRARRLLRECVFGPAD